MLGLTDSETRQAKLLFHPNHLQQNVFAEESPEHKDDDDDFNPTQTCCSAKQRLQGQKVQRYPLTVHVVFTFSLLFLSPENKNSPLN